MPRVSVCKDQDCASWQPPAGLPANRDDIQDAIVEIMTKGGCDRNGESFDIGAILQLARWKRLSTARQEYRRRELLVLKQSSLISSTVDPRLSTERAELVQRFLDVLDQLPEQQRSILHAESQVSPPIHERIASGV